MLALQSRAARSLLNWTQEKLAEESAVSIGAIRNFENGHSTPIRANLMLLQKTFEAAGIEFIAPNGGGPGVRLKDWPLPDPTAG